MTPPNNPEIRPDWRGVAAIAVVSYLIATIVHEGIGHGGTCWLVGCKPKLVTAMQFIGDESAISPARIRLIAAGGTIWNLIAALLATVWRRRVRKASDSFWFFLWLFGTTNLLHACGYWLYSGVTNIGDWADVIKGWQPAWVWRVLLAGGGGAAYWFAVRWSMGELARRLSPDRATRVHEAHRYTFLPFLLGGALEMCAGVFEPGGGVIVLISGAAASLGGLSGLMWGPRLLFAPSLGVPRGRALVVTFDRLWAIAGLIAALVFIFGLGRGISVAW